MTDKRERLRTIAAIIDRAQETGIFAQWPRLTMFMDVDIALEQFDIDPADFLALDESTFLHDFAGIVCNMNRKTGKVENCFLPRCGNAKAQNDCTHEETENAGLNERVCKRCGIYLPL